MDLIRNDLVEESAELFVDDVQEWSLDDADWSIESTQELVVYWMRDGEGTTEVRATDANANGLGRSWAVPLPTGNVQLNIVSQEVMMVHGNGAFGDFTEVALPSDLVGVRTDWSKTMTINEAQVVHITTTTDAQLMVTIGGEGTTTWKSLTGSIHGTSFIPPTQEGFFSSQSERGTCNGDMAWVWCDH